MHYIVPTATSLSTMTHDGLEILERSLFMIKLNSRDAVSYTDPMQYST